MSKNFVNLACASLLMCMSVAVQGQTLKGMTLEPANAKVGEVVTIKANFDLGDNPNCGVKVHFGDGAATEGRINQAKDSTFSASHSYAKAGTYTVMVEPKRVGASLKCLGPNAKATLVVTAPVAAPAAAAGSAALAGKPAATGPSCPAGWKLNAKSVNKKTGAFQCTAKPGTAAPAAKLDCPGNLSYVENVKKGLLACQP